MSVAVPAGTLLPFLKPVAAILSCDDVFNIPFLLLMKAGAWR
jgi:hypothetical protein